jgi:hypothetical protein
LAACLRCWSVHLHGKRLQTIYSFVCYRVYCYRLLKHKSFAALRVVTDITTAIEWWGIFGMISERLGKK